MVRRPSLGEFAAAVQKLLHSLKDVLWSSHPIIAPFQFGHELTRVVEAIDGQSAKGERVVIRADSSDRRRYPAFVPGAFQQFHKRFDKLPVRAGEGVRIGKSPDRLTQFVFNDRL